jgi:hypothetical protein
LKWEFTEEDLKKIEKKTEKKIERIKKYREYSLSPQKQSKLKKLEEKKRYLEKILRRKSENSFYQSTKSAINDSSTSSFAFFLDSLNRGEYQFLRKKAGYIVNPYYGKVRLILNNKNTTKKEKELENEDNLVIGLLSYKLNQYLEKYKARKPSRREAIKRLIFYIKKKQKKHKIIIRGDFRNYTLNIPRQRVMEILEKREIPPHILKLLNSYFDTGNHFSRIVGKGNIKRFFKNIGLENNLNKDADFKGFLNYDGLFPGTPLSNVLGQIFLLDFDKKMEEIVGENGFFIRYFDDFILIKSFEEKVINSEFLEQEKEKIKKEINNFITTHYRISESKIGEILEIEKEIIFSAEKKGEEIFDFLGYLFKIKNNSNVKISVRYKTLKKFVYKYLYEYDYLSYRQKFKNNPKFETSKNYWRGKLFYLYSWVKSFNFINDKKLLDEIYINIILPDIYSFLKRHREETNLDIKFFKTYYRLTTIHRIFKKQEKKNENKKKVSKSFILNEIKKIFKEPF